MKLMRLTRAPQCGNSKVFARANMESLEFVETYIYEKNISKNPYLRGLQVPTGRIEAQVPFDGYCTFPRQARDDIEHQIGSRSSTAGLEAKIGHLALTDFGRTDLKSVLNLSDRCGSVPVAIPLSGGGLESLDQLGHDRYAGIVYFDYAPCPPEVIPIDIDLSLWDEESLSNPDGEIFAESNSQGSESFTVRIKTQERFLRSLLIQITGRVFLPAGFLPEDAKPTISRISLGWPSITSLRGLRLLVGIADAKREVPIRYDPVTRCLEWLHIPLIRAAKSEGMSSQLFESEPMQLSIDHPGELYQQTALDGAMEIEVPGRLLSGLKMALFDSLGARITTIEPKLTTKLQVYYKLVLNEAFARRILSPYQHLHFQEIVPDEMRIADLKNALVDRGFRILGEFSLARGKETQHILKAERPEAPDPLQFTVLVAGIHQEAERQTQFNGGQIYTSKVQSGDIRVYVRGELRGNSRRLIQEMNAFQAALRVLFPQVRARR